MTPIEADLLFDLINAFRQLKTDADSANFLQDILTANEIKNLSVRLRVAKLLLSGAPQRDIANNLKISTATITKINSWLNTKGEGFTRVIKKLPSKYNFPTKKIHGPIEYHMPEVLIGLVQYSVAASQNKKINKFIEDVESKEGLDKSIKKAAADYYKHRSTTVRQK